MIRMFVSDLARGEKFYHEVLGTTVVQKMGDNALLDGCVNAFRYENHPLLEKLIFTLLACQLF